MTLQPTPQGPNLRMAKFKIHAMAFVGVNILLALFNIAMGGDIMTGHHLWFPWVILGWGAGLGLHYTLLKLA